MAYGRQYVEDVSLSFNRSGVDGYQLAGMYKRLGKLYDQRGDCAEALDYYNRFVELWKDADAELQPDVQECAGQNWNS